MPIKVEKSTMDDLELSCWLFEQAIAYQKEISVPSYSLVDRGSHRSDIERGVSYKILCEGEVAMMFSLCQHDELIWKHIPRIPSLFIHKATTHPDHRGKALFGRVVEHARTVANELGSNALRMDTWAENAKLIEVYESYGFVHIEDHQVPDEAGIPLNTRGNKVALLEMRSSDE